MKKNLIWISLKSILILSLLSSLFSGCLSAGSGYFKSNIETNDGTKINIEAQAEDLNKGVQKTQETK